MVQSNQVIMGRRLGQLTGVFAVGLVIVRLGRLLQSGPDIVQWNLILVASVFLGAVVWWLLDQLSFTRKSTIALFAAAGVVLLLRISVPMTLIGGVMPSLDTLGALVAEMSDALRIIRSGVPPVLPSEGIVAILAMVMWAIGALYAWGLSGGPVAAMSLPSIVVYLQFAVFDRVGAGLGWMTAAGLTLALAMTSVALDRRSETGRARDSEGRAMPRRSLRTTATMAGLIGLVAVTVATGASGLVSEYGTIPWRTGGTGFGGDGSRISFDRFVDLRQSLISRSNTVLFQASLGDGAPAAETIYWRMETLDTFDGVAWSRSAGSFRNYEPDQDVGSDHLRYQGSTVDVLQKVRIEALAEQRVPTAGVPDEIHRISETDGIDPQAFHVTQDSSIVYTPGLREGDIYQLRATYPDRDADLGLLATDASGDLSPLFATAAGEGAFNVRPDSRETDIEVPPDLASYTDLPEDIPPSLRGIAAIHTRGASTDFERAWMLQHWFRDSGDFIYSTDVSTGHGALLLDDWLTDPASQNYRTGYCEQFATSMAVLGRVLGIPSRVVLGFTPGEVTEDGVIQVRDTNAHAWVEMWMPCCGWVQFDPTPRGEYQPASLTAAFDPEGFVSDLEPGDVLASPENPNIGPGTIDITDVPPVGGGQGTPRWWLLIFPAAALAASLIPSAKRFRRRRRLKKARAGDITAVWDEIVDRLIDLGEPVPASMTPLELARGTDDSLLALAVTYSAAVYGGRVGDASELDLLTLEAWLTKRYDTGRRLRAALSTRSLLDR